MKTVSAKVALPLRPDTGPQSGFTALDLNLD
jgi:hypothetical protein